MLAFYDCPGVHWTHLRTTNVIESSLATIRHRGKRAKGCVTRQSMLSMIYKVGMCAEKSWRRLRGFRQLAKVIEGVNSTTASRSSRTAEPPHDELDAHQFDYSFSPWNPQKGRKG